MITAYSAKSTLLVRYTFESSIKKKKKEMKRIMFLILALGVVVMLMLSSCSFESYHSVCPTYSHNKNTKHGEKAQIKYIKRKI